MADRTMRFAKRMTDAEALMWNLEKDPALRSAFGNLTIFDRPLDIDRFRRRMTTVVSAVPRLRQRVVSAPGRLAPPEWEDDPTFDVEYHIRRMGVPPPGGTRELLELAALLLEDPLDRARPQWQFTLLEGLADGRGAMVQKMHHTITDGEGGVRLSAMFVDLERDPDEPEPEVAHTGGEEASARNPLEVARDTFVDFVRRPVGLAGSALQTTVDTVTHPWQAPQRAASAVATSRAAVRQLAVTEPARSPLWTSRGMKRRLEIVSVPLDDAKRASKALGGTLNDLFVAAATGAAGAYHRAEGAEVGDLRMAMPVSTRTDKSAGGNAFSPTRVLVPAGIVDPAERFEAIRERLSSTKAEGAMNLVDRLAGVMNLLPTSVLVRTARQQVQTVDFATSNVRGAPFDLYMAGALVLGNHPMGPTGGTAFNLTLLSYRGNLDMGLNIDVAAVRDPDLLRDCLVEAFDELLALG